jgi:hypothetical protein
MLPSRFGIEQEIRILGSILEAADYLIDAKPDTRTSYHRRHYLLKP